MIITTKKNTKTLLLKKVPPVSFFAFTVEWGLTRDVKNILRRCQYLCARVCMWERDEGLGVAPFNDKMTHDIFFN